MLSRCSALCFVILLLAAGVSLVRSSEVQRPEGIQVLYYSRGVMARVAQNHMNPAFARSGDYVPGMRLRRDADCLTAVNWNSRWMLGANVVLVVDLYDKVQQRWERHRCQASDYQQRRHSTGSRQRLEIDWETAVVVNAVPSNTVARIIELSYPSRFTQYVGQAR